MRQAKTAKLLASTIRSKGHLVEVRFGRMSQNCQNFGFCRIEPFSKSGERFDAKSILATMSFHDGELCFSFKKRNLLGIVYGKYFGSGYFLVGEDFCLSDNCCQLLEIDGFVIRKGLYALENKGEINLYF